MRVLLDTVQTPSEFTTWTDLIGDRNHLVAAITRLHATSLAEWAGQIELAEHCWLALRHQRMRRCLEHNTTDDSHFLFAADPARLHHNALATFAAGTAAALLRWCRNQADVALLAKWLGRAADPQSEPALDLMSVDIPPGEIHDKDRLDWVGGVLPRRWREVLLIRLASALQVPWLDVVPPVRTRIVAFATANDREERGTIYLLSWYLLAGGAVGLLEDPGEWNRPLAADWLAVLREAYERCDFDRPVVWSLEKLSLDLDRPEGSEPGWKLLAGASHTLAARVGLHVLRHALDQDPGVLLAAAVDEADELAPVEGLKKKCDAAWQSGRFHAVLIADKVDRQQFDETKLPFGDRSRQMKIERCRRFDEALHWATGLAGGLRRYLEWVRQRVDENLPGYLAGQPLSQIYIAPRVQRHDPGLESGGPMMVGSEAEELVLRYRGGQPTRSIAWQDEWEKVQRAVLIGFAGEGKTVLARMTARELARRSLEQLSDPQTSIRDVGLPILVSLASVAKLKSLKAALRVSLPETIPPIAVKHLEDNLLRKSTWLILDGLDEVSERDWSLVEAELGPLGDAPCRLLLTSRPYGYRKPAAWQAALVEYKLAPLDASQRRQFVDAWFQGREPQRRDAVHRLMQGTPAMADVARNAMLLTLACFVGDKENLNASTMRRTKLYTGILWHLLAGRGDEQSTDLGKEKIRQHLRLLRRMAWTLFQDEPHLWSFHDDQWFDALLAALSAERSQDDPSELLARWRHLGVLVPVGIEETGFLHRTFLEFLAGAQVASRPDAVAQIEAYLWQPDEKEELHWQPVAEEFIAFTAGCLADPTGLLRRLLEEADTRPDALWTMERLAGRCLGEVEERKVPRDIMERIVDACATAWNKLGRTGSVARSLAHRAGVGRLAASLVDSFASRRIAASEVLGFLGDQQVVPPLLLVLQSDLDCDVRSSVARTLGLLGDPQAIKHLLRVLMKDDDGTVRAAAAQSLDRLGDRQATPPLLRALRESPEWSVRYAAVDALGLLGDREAVPVLIDAAQSDAQTDVRLAAGRALGLLRDNTAHEPLLHILQSDSAWNVRAAAAEALGRLGNPKATTQLLGVLDVGRDKRVAPAAMKALGVLGARQAVPHLLNGLQADSDGPVRAAAAEAIGWLADRQTVGALLDALTGDRDPTVRRAVARALGMLGNRLAVGPLIAVLRDDAEWVVRAAAANALGWLSDQQAVEPLLQAWQSDPDQIPRVSAARALTQFRALSTWLPRPADR